MNISVPCHLSFRPTSVLAVPTQLAMWMSWPQLWATNVSRPCHMVLSWLALPKAGFFFHRQRVELGAHHDGGAFAILVNGNQPGLADLFSDLKTQRAHLGGELARGFLFLKGDLRVGVDILVERVEFWVIGFHRSLDRGLETVDIDLRARGQDGDRA